MSLKLETYKLELEEFCLHIAQLILYTMASNLLIAAVLFAMGMTVTALLLPASFITGVILLAAFYGKKIDRMIAFEVIGTVILFVVLTWFAGLFYDMSWDGNAYHKMAVGLLKNNWNPLKELPSLSITEGAGISSGNELWIEAYCKMTWIFAASIYAITGNIETGKMYTLLGMVCAFLITVAFLKKKKKSNGFCFLFALIAALNPIAVLQMDSFYIDGFLHVILYVLVISLIMETDSESFQSWRSRSLIAASMIICGNIKFTGLLYGGIFCIAYYVWKCIGIIKRNKTSWFTPCLYSGLRYLGLALVTMFWAGSSTYLTNLINHKTFTYPLTGADTVDIVTVHSPFTEVNRVKNLLISLFSKLDNCSVTSGGVPELKIPFSVYWAEEGQFLSIPDARVSGFGIFFGGIIIISAVILIVGLIKIEKDYKFQILFLNIIVCLGLTLGITESWWARYAPYIYFLVLMAMFIALDSQKRMVRGIGVLLSMLILLNNCLPIYRVPRDIHLSNKTSRKIAALKNNGPVYVYTPNFDGIYFNLRDQDVTYILNLDLLEDEQAVSLGYGDVKWKLQ